MSKLSLFVLALVAIVAFRTQQAGAQQPSVEAATVAKQVLTHTEWVTETGKCPAEIFPKSEASDRTARCSSGELNACLSRCEDSDADACYWLGQSMIPESASRSAAQVLFQRACKLGVVSGCTNRAAGILKQSQDDPHAQSCAAETFSKGCSLNDPWACTMYALHLSRGLGIKRDPNLALKALDKSCKNGPEDDACKFGRGLQKQVLEAGAKSDSN